MAQCTAHAKSTGRQCTRPSIVGGSVCWYHGGAAPQVQRAASLRREHATALAWAASELERIGTPDRDPLEHLEAVLEQDARTYALWSLACETLTADGDPLLSEDKHGQRAIHPYVSERNLAAQRWSATAKRALDAGVSQRRVMIEQQRADMMAQAMRATLAALGLSQELQARGVAKLGAELRRLNAGPDVHDTSD